VGLKAQLGKAVMKRVEAMPAVQAQKERSERVSPAQRAARKLAYSSQDDETAKLALAELLEVDANVLREATIDLARRRDDYIDDRAYRLLSAAAAGTQVQPIPPERQELFAEEEAIGRMPIEQAFQRLAELEPRLIGVEHLAEGDGQDEDGDACGLPQRLRKELLGLVGGGADEHHELLRTTLATSIVNQYFLQLAGNARMGDPSVAYFDSPTKHFVASVSFGRPQRRTS